MRRPSDVPGPTLLDLLERAAASGTGGLRFIDRQENQSFLDWREIHQRALASSRWLADRGVSPGMRVGIIFRTSIGFFDAFLGALFAGAVPVPLYPPVRLGRLDEYHRRTAAMLDAVDAGLLVADPLVARLLGETVRRCRGGLRLEVLTRLPAAADSEGPVARPAEDDLALVQFSSGTTVEPKPVALSHRAILAQVEILNRHWGHLPGASGVSWLPLYHDMGLIGCVFPAQDVAAELTLIPAELFVARPAIWLRTLSRFRGMISPAPNFAYGLCLEKIHDEEMEGVDLSAWRVALNGAEAVSATVMRRFIRRFGRWGLRPEALSPVYGLSEASLAVTFSDLDQPFTSHRFATEELVEKGQARPAAQGTELVSVGRPLPGFEIEIRRGEDGVDGGQRLAEAQIGRLWVRGPSMMEGYLVSRAGSSLPGPPHGTLGWPEADRSAFVDGWFDTGDEGFLFDGELYLTGRAKDMLILNGRNHAPEDVERAIDGVPGVRTGCAAAVSYRRSGAATEALILFVETRLPSRAAEEIALDCRRAVLSAAGLRVEEVFVLAPGTLPRTSSGKIRRQEALARHLAGTLEPPLRVTWWRLVWAMARSRWALARRTAE
ncbi:MAG: AMP-binding protein [Acidobacteria bacterium]|nr:AMP-binding protein [Acidobacteriota bacterium]